MDDAGPITPGIVTTLPAVGISVTMAFGGTAQMVIQTHVPQDEPHTWDRVSDQLMATARRQKAIFDMPALIEELAMIERRFKDRERDIGQVRAKQLEAHADRTKAVAEAEMAYGDQRKQYERKFANSGRQGTYKPVGAEKSALEQLMAVLERAEADLKACDADMQNGEVTFKAQTLEWDRNRREVEAKIAEAKALIGG